MADPQLPDELRDEMRASWHRYIDLLAPLRPALYRYCRRLTGNIWDAEDLLQDTLIRAFGKLGSIHQEVRNPRAYLFRTATNVWIDTIRRRGTESSALPPLKEPASESPELAGAVRDAAAQLMQRLAPQERACVVLKDVFEFSLEEIAEVLGTTAGAVKAALHRGRGRLREPDERRASQRSVPSVELVDQFVRLYEDKDLNGLVKLMVESGSVENVGISVEYGPDFDRRGGWFHRAVYGHPEWPKEFQYESARVERAIFEDEPIVLCFATRRGREALEVVLRIEEQEGHISRLRGYAFCPDVMLEMGELLGLKVRTGLYRYPTPEPGKIYPDPG